MLKSLCCIKYVLLLIIIQACIEPYDFAIPSQDDDLVVEAMITDASYDETISYPSDGRYFKVKLSRVSGVKNILNQPVSGASVKIITSQQDSLFLEERSDGQYFILDQCFKAIEGVQYRLKILLQDNAVFESTWEQLPNVDNVMGDISFEETEEKMIRDVNGENYIIDVPGINFQVDLKENNQEKPIYYLWEYDPTWIFRAPLPQAWNRTCYVTNQNYISQNTIKKDQVGGYKQTLFFKSMEDNERFIYRFSLLVNQYVISEQYFDYLREMKELSSSKFSDAPPYNLHTNISSSSGSNVHGYFSVAREQAKRIYLEGSDLEYFIEDEYKKDCLNPLTEIEAICFDCTVYPNGEASLIAPSWWQE